MTFRCLWGRGERGHVRRAGRKGEGLNTEPTFLGKS